MSSQFAISPEAYDLILDSINLQFCQEGPGLPKDLAFINNDFWLQDTAVIEMVEKRQGLWKVALLFVHHINPFRFIKRTITGYADIHKAQTAAHYMRRQAAKDQRGTLVVSTASLLFGHS